MEGSSGKRRILVRTAVVLVVCLLLTTSVAGALVHAGIQRTEAQARYTAEAATRRVEAQINKYLVVTDVLRRLVESGCELSREDFAVLSRCVMDEGGVIEVVEYARDGIVSDVYPLAGNEEALGLNLLENPERAQEANLAMTTGQYTIAGPFELAQGGTGALLLDPIHVRDGEGGERFWGFSLLVLNWNAFLEEVWFDRMSESGYHYRLWRVSPATGERLLIAECGDSTRERMLQVVCEVPNDTWYFEIAPKAGWLTAGEKALSVVSVLLISLLVAFIYWQYAERRQQEQRYREALKRAAAEARAASEAKTRFLFNMSHDIRTPMNAILGFAAMAEQNLDRRELVRDSLEKVSLAGRELLDLINSILNISRIESGAMKPVMEQADLRDLRRTMAMLFEQSMADRGIRFDTSVSLRDARVVCDMQHLREICINLLSNAQKFTPEGGSVSFAITQCGEARQGRAPYTLCVRDTGIGMSEAFQKIQFELFERENSGEVARTEGTGLGLPIVKRLVDMLGGTIACESEKGRGTVYTLTFTLEVAPQEPADGAPSGDAADDAALAGRHVLLVEDNALNREIALYLLDALSLRVDTAEDGTEAVERVASSAGDPYDLVLMDIQMPRMNGYEAARRIRALPEAALAQVPIVAMTANAFEEDRRNAMAAGMNDHVAKPIDARVLRETLHRLLVGGERP